MKPAQILFFIAFAGCSIVAQAADIPAQFRGQWGETAKTCNRNAPESENLVKISEKRLDGYEIGCRLKKVKVATETLFEGAFACAVEGETSNNQYRLELLDGGKTLLSNGNKLIRCK